MPPPASTALNISLRNPGGALRVVPMRADGFTARAASSIARVRVATPLAVSIKVRLTFHARCSASARPRMARKVSPGAIQSPLACAVSASAPRLRAMRTASSTPHSTKPSRLAENISSP